MQQVKLPTSVWDQLGAGRSELEVVDDSGQIKGYLISPEYRALIYSWVKTQFKDDEDLARARAEVGGYSTPEAVQYLRTLESNFRGRQ